MTPMFSKKEKMWMAIAGFIFIFCVSVVIYDLNKAALYVEQHGLKSVVDDVWNGRQP